MNKPIINGIDVSECRFYEPKAQKMTCHEEAITKPCESTPICYYKLLQKSYIEIQRLQEENEKLKANKGRCAFKCLDNTFCDEAKIKIDKLELDKDCLNASLETARKYRGIAESDRGKYKQALEEIREIAKYSIMHNSNLNSNYQIILQNISEAFSNE